MRNLELKVLCSDGVNLDALARQALAGGAVYIRTMGSAILTSWYRVAG